MSGQLWADALVAARLGKVVPADDLAVALNTAFMGDGAVIRVAAGATLERPLHLVFAASGDKPAAIFTRSLVVIEKGALVMLVESHEGLGVGPGDYQVNTAVELVVGDDAHVDHVKITDFGIATAAAAADRNSAVAGTPQYMAPEQLTGSAASTRARTPSQERVSR